MDTITHIIFMVDKKLIEHLFIILTPMPHLMAHIGMKNATFHTFWRKTQ